MPGRMIDFLHFSSLLMEQGIHRSRRQQGDLTLLYIKPPHPLVRRTGGRGWCWRTKESHNSPESRSIAKVYLFGNKLTESVGIRSLLHALRTGTESSSLLFL